MIADDQRVNEIQDYNDAYKLEKKMHRKLHKKRSSDAMVDKEVNMFDQGLQDSYQGSSFEGARKLPSLTNVNVLNNDYSTI